jgi:hypothetical protein
MRPPTALRAVALSLALSLLSLFACDSDKCTSWPRCIAGSSFNEKTCECGPILDTGSVPDAAAAADAAVATSCAMPPAAQDAGANVVACLVARASLECPVAGGGICGCLSEDPKSCSECGASTTCSNRCEAHEYAMACGGPPQRDGGSYAEAPASCRSVAGFPSGSAIYCCPCL